MQPISPASAPASLREQRLWQIARARTKFQSHAFVYLVINAGLWLLWALAPEAHAHAHRELPWPIWSTVFWGAAVVSQGMAAYSRLNRGERTQREYERLLAEGN